MRDEFCHNNSTTYLSTSGISTTEVPPIYCGESLEYLAFFSSNSCIFYHQTQKSRFNCPTGGFQCDGNGTRLFYETKDLTYSGAISYCRQRNASLCKKTGIHGLWRHQINILWIISYDLYQMVHMIWILIWSYHMNPLIWSPYYGLWKFIIT